MIIGSRALGKSDPGATYTLLRPLGHDRFASHWPDCGEELARRYNLLRDKEVFRFATLEALPSALKPTPPTNRSARRLGAAISNQSRLRIVVIIRSARSASPRRPESSATAKACTAA